QATAGRREAGRDPSPTAPGVPDAAHRREDSSSALLLLSRRCGFSGLWGDGFCLGQARHTWHPQLLLWRVYLRRPHRRGGGDGDRDGPSLLVASRGEITTP